MKRLASLVVLALVTASGCAMCQNPWDYCNAVVGPGGPNCDFGARAGSVFHPMGGTPPATERGPTPAPAKSGSSTESAEAAEEVPPASDYAPRGALP